MTHPVHNESGPGLSPRAASPGNHVRTRTDGNTHHAVAILSHPKGRLLHAKANTDLRHSARTRHADPPGPALRHPRRAGRRLEMAYQAGVADGIAPRPGRVVIDMAALREAWEDGYDAIIAIDAGKPDRARVYLKNATDPAFRAFPDDRRRVVLPGAGVRRPHRGGEHDRHRAEQDTRMQPSMTRTCGSGSTGSPPQAGHAARSRPRPSAPPAPSASAACKMRRHAVSGSGSGAAKTSSIPAAACAGTASM